MKYDDIPILIKDKTYHKLLALWAAACAEHVLIYFEEKIPNDARPRNAIEAARAWVNDELKMTDARKAAFAAHAAARETEDKSAIAAARSAAHAAATAHVASHSIHAVDYVCKALKFLDNSETIIAAERDWQLIYLQELLKNRNL